MTVIEKIDIPEISLSQQKITDFIELSIELRESEAENLFDKLHKWLYE